MNKRQLLISILIFFLVWNFITVFIFWSKTSEKFISKKKLGKDFEELNDMIVKLKEQSSQQEILHKRISEQLNNLKPSATTLQTEITPSPKIAVLVLCCNRPFVKKIIKKILDLRPVDKFPLVVSQDCEHQATADAIASFNDRILYIHQPNQTDFILPPKSRHLKGYYRISRHYKFALNHVFNFLNYEAVIVVEDDLDISDDFFEYFSSTLPLLLRDPSLWCVSAWNDNGKKGLVDEENSAALLYRTDFFPGLGWMLLKSLWQELQNKWPDTYWDDWMRHPRQRQGRACIRPEIPRSSTFGKVGVSKGQFFDKHLKYIKHCQKFVPFSRLDMSYLIKDKYDKQFIGYVYSLAPIRLHQLTDVHRRLDSALRIEYNNHLEFASIAKRLAIMDDWKSDIPRMGYRGIVSVMFNGKRIHVAPPIAS